ncbi:hypothetical protein KKG05_04465 [bacterium]|nr:hypothetical protein [bacterium]MBU1936631.1 hypothetical protein [bacterium]
MEYFFRCPSEFFKSQLVKTDKPVSPGMALLAVISKVAFGCYRVQGEDDTTVEIRPGQFPVDVERLQRLTGWSTKQMTEFLYFLVDNNVLERKVVSGVTVATFKPEALLDLPPYK